RRGDACMVMVSDHAAGLHNGLICRYIRWHRPDGRSGRYWREIEVPARPGRAGAHRYKLFYTPGKMTELMSRPLSDLRREIGDDAWLGAALGAEHQDACEGLLCSPYAMTNHRAQGSTFQKTLVVIPPWLDRTQCAEWLYVAI